MKQKLRLWLLKKIGGVPKEWSTIDYHYHKENDDLFMDCVSIAVRNARQQHPEYKMVRLDVYFLMSFLKRFLGEWIGKRNNQVTGQRKIETRK